MTDRPWGSSVFIFHVVGEETLGRRFAVAYCSSKQFTPRDLEMALKVDFRQHLPPEQLLLLAPQGARDCVDDALNDEEIRDRYIDATSLAPRALYFDVAGTLSPGATADDESLMSSVKAAGMLTILSRYDVLQDPGPAFHYRKQSDYHSRSFLRVGSALAHASEIGFIGFCLLPLLGGVRHIYTDSASINSAAYAAAQLRTQLDESFLHPTIESFDSYEGLPGFRPESPEQSVALISIVTSNGLLGADALGGKLREDRIMALYWLGDASESDRRIRYLCDATREVLGVQPLAPIENHHPDSCPLCAEDSVPIQIVGGDFLYADPVVEPAVIRQPDMPRDFTRLSREALGQHVFRVHHRTGTGSGGPVRHVSLDPLNLFDNGRALRRALLAKLHEIGDVRLIIYADDEPSKRMMEIALDHFRWPCGVMSVDEFTEAAPEDLLTANDPKGCVLVLSSTLVSSRGLHGVAQLLRVHPPPRVHYIVGIGRPSSEETWTRLRSDLGFTRKESSNAFHELRTIYLPDDDDPAGQPWMREEAFLAELDERADTAGLVEDDRRKLQEDVRKRRQYLSATRDAGGLEDRLFLPRWHHDAYRLHPRAERSEYLTIRGGFVFWQGFQPRDATQAEAYVTMLTVVHELRKRPPGGDKDSLKQHTQRRALLSPGNFLRYNDGVLQASLLRCARKAELDYRLDPRSSAEMAGSLQVIFRYATRKVGEAAPEFLLALATRQLQLVREDRDAVLRTLLAQDLPAVLRLMAKMAQDVPGETRTREAAGAPSESNETDEREVPASGGPEGS